MEELSQKNEIFFEHNINPVVLELLYEYVVQLTSLVISTYLGDKYYNHYKKRERNVKIENHFMFCMGKVDKNFSKLGYSVANDPTIATYLLGVFESEFYDADKKDIAKLNQQLLNKFSFIHVQGGLSESKTQILKEIYESFVYSFRFK